MNRNIIESSETIPVVYCWLEACGIGGHALLVDGTSKGCVECLVQDNEHGPYIKSTFLERNQNVTKDLTGCGSGFTPFSALDAIKTAILATELTLEYLLNSKLTDYRFWTGSDNIAKSEGLKTSNWYRRVTEENVDHIGRSFSRQSCPVCGARN